MRDFDQSWRSRLADLSGQGRLRQLAQSHRLPDGRIERDGTRLLDFSSNDYLGLARHPAVKRRSAEYLERWGAGSAASRLVTGNLPPYPAIEEKLAAGKGAEAALVLASGFQANAGLLPALLDAGLWDKPPVVLADKLNHASLLHGVQAAGARQARFRHNDMGHLEDLLIKHRGEGPCFIVTETVFSMDGDRADLDALTALADRYDAFLYLDEAHATGVLGPNGFGLAHGLAGSNCLVMGTFSKGMGSFGAYAACSATLKEYLVNRCAGLIYATALPPATLGAIDAALDLVPGMEAERTHLAALAEDFRTCLQAAGEDCGASSTQIVPLIVGSEQTALDLAAALKRQGLLAIAIRPPTVPPGGSRLRFAFAAHHRAEDVARLADALASIREAA
ncbi:MAG TPA: 8-amino-7-oxononanoate synthase [Magnetospirillaceae bacterium]|nr:8-amino-7-oxononanoate synthase [Magnetospirillaceae bacterium]